MLFEAMNEGRRIVEVYEKTIVYEFDDDGAYIVTPNGNRRPVALHQALDEIAGFRARDGRSYSYELATGNQSYLWLAAVAVLASLAAALWLVWWW